MFKNFKKSTIAHLSLALIYFTSGFIINFFQLILYVFVRPVNKYWYRKINYYCVFSHFAQYAFLSEWWSDSILKVYMDENDFDHYLGKEHTLAVLNHTYEIDWLILSCIMNNRDALGNVRTYGKKSLQYYPVVGWTHYLSEGIFLCRSYDKDAAIIKEKAREYCDYPNPVTVFLCPEGTRYTKEKLVKSIEFAESRNLPIFKHLLTIKTKGFTATLPNIRDKFGSILDITLAFDPNEVTPTMLSLLNGYSLTGHIYIKRYPMKDVPIDTEDASEFLNNLFIKKDKLLESFFTTGSFFTNSDVEEIPPIEIKNEFKTLCNTIFWGCVTYFLLILYIIIYTENTINLFLLIGILGGLFALMKFGVKLSEAKDKKSPLNSLKQ